MHGGVAHKHGKCPESVPFKDAGDELLTAFVGGLPGHLLPMVARADHRCAQVVWVGMEPSQRGPFGAEISLRPGVSLVAPDGTDLAGVVKRDR